MTKGPYQVLRDSALWPLFRMATDHYRVNTKLRIYHNIEHADAVVEGINKLTEHNPSLALVIAGLWHDAIYFPSAGSDANERCSSTALGIDARNVAQSVELTQDEKNAVNAAQDMIEQTHVAVHLRRDYEGAINGELAILLDADLHALAAPYDVFLQNQNNIILENGGSVKTDQKRSAEFLVHFLQCREYIYHTEKGRELWEYAARANITKYCNENKVAINAEK